MIDVEFRGGQDFARAAAALRGGDKEIRKRLNKALRAAAAPIVAEQRANILAMQSTASGGGGGASARARVAVERSTSKGRARVKAGVGRRLAAGGFGLRSTIAKAVQVKITLNGRSPGVRIRVDSARLGHLGRNLPARIDEGSWRHPVFGNRDVWVTQTGAKDWFSGPARTGRTAARREIAEALGQAIDDIQRKA